MPEMDRRTMMLMTGVGVLAAAVPVPQARAYPRPPDAPPGSYLFHDEFDGSAGSAPDPSKWTVATTREPMKDPTFWERPENVGQYRDDRQNVFLDGKSNLVLRAAKDGNTYYSGKVQSPWHGGIGHTWEARIKLNCLTAGCWPAWWLGNEDNGEIDALEWYGNGSWPAGTTVHAASNGKTWEGKSIPGLVDGGWHTWQMHWGEDGFAFSRDGAPYFHVPPKPIHVAGGAPDDFRWPFNLPDYWMTPMFTLAVGGVGAGDPAAGTFPASMLVDYIRIW
jgi:hypothetical protein